MRADDVTIRPLRASDEPQWRALWKAYLAFYETERPEEIYRSSFDRMLSGDPNEFKGLVAEQDGKLVGLAHYLFRRNGWTIENCCYLQDLFTDPALRGKGVGRALIEAVYAAADAAGAPAVHWLTQEFNYKGRILYDQMGVKAPFVRYDRQI